MKELFERGVFSRYRTYMAIWKLKAFVRQMIYFKCNFGYFPSSVAKNEERYLFNVSSCVGSPLLPVHAPKRGGEGGG